MEKNKEEFSDWYHRILTDGGFIRFYDVSGCYVLLPYSYEIWETIKEYLDNGFKKRGVKNSYFPMFLTQKNLYREKEHVEGFTPEVAWVTGYGDIKNKDEFSEMKEPVCLRPTSETIMYPILADILESHYELPYKINQWCNVVRWEFKDPTPFIRSREFLWNEGHSVFLTEKEADDDAKEMISFYGETYKNLLAVPTIQGRKTINDKFPGGKTTYTIETFIPEIGKGIQCATSHDLGQNFSKIFDITVGDEDGKQTHVHQTSWGFTTRSIGAMIMTHKGIIPPFVAPIQIVVIPVIFKKKKEETMEYAKKVYSSLKSIFRVEIDLRQKNPGWKYNYWETRGVPLRIEVGPKDMENNAMMLCRRDRFKEKISVAFDKSLMDTVDEMLKTIQNELYLAAEKKLFDSIIETEFVEEVVNNLENKKVTCSSFCESDECEDELKKFGARSLCIPDQKLYDCSGKCIVCNKETDLVCLFGKTF